MVSDLASPEAAFMRDECELHVAAVEAKAKGFEAWQKWCQRNGDAFPGTLDVFATRLLAAANGASGLRRCIAGGERVPSFKGIRLLAEQHTGGEQMPF